MRVTIVVMKLDINAIREQQLPIDFLAKKLVEGFITGLHKSPYHGFSVEFAEHRLYNNGESTRHIDWKVFAKTDKLFTKRFEEETNLRCHIIIDASSSMRYPSDSQAKLHFSVYAAAELSWLLHKQRDAVGITTFSDKILNQSEVKSTQTHIHKLFIMLDELLKSTVEQLHTNISSVLHEVANTIHKRSLVIIFSDMFSGAESHDDLISSLMHLRHNKHEVVLFHVADHETEVDFEFTDRPHLFIDLESGKKIKLQPSQVKQSYASRARSELNYFKNKCGQLGIEFIAADVHEDYNHIFNSFLIKRSKMN